MSATGTSRNEQDFFDVAKPWSGIKHRILYKYLDTYVTIRKNSERQIFFVDGYAGAGEYGSQDGATSPGSPLLIAQIAQDFAESGHSSSLVCYAVEKQRTRYDQLCAALAQYPGASVRPLLGSFLNHLDQILNEIGAAPAVFFLDPFGVKGSSLSELRPLIRRADTEIILIFNSFRLAKLAGFEDSNAKDAVQKRRLVSMILNETVDNPDSEWIQKYREFADERKWTDWAVNKYTSELIEGSPYLNHGLAYPVRKRFQGPPTYHLIYATRSTAGLPVMNDLICAEEDVLFDDVWTRGGSQASLFPNFRENDV